MCCEWFVYGLCVIVLLLRSVVVRVCVSCVFAVRLFVWFVCDGAALCTVFVRFMCLLYGLCMVCACLFCFFVRCLYFFVCVELCMVSVWFVCDCSAV